MPASSIVTPERQDILEEDILAKGSVSEALLRKIAASLNAANYYSALPLGTIVENFIPPTKFFSLATGAYYELNGQEYTATDLGQWEISEGLKSGTLYLPDGRGMELVQVNNGRADGKENFLNLQAGDFQASGNKSHSHTFVGGPNTSGAQSRIVYGTNGNVSSSAVGGLINSDGQPQVTTNRIGVYRYIKVWNVDPNL